MPKGPTSHLSRRERQIMDIVYSRGRVTATEVRGLLPDPPSYSAVRSMLRILEEKGHLRHEQDGPRYVYSPTTSPAKARESALRHLVRTFFDGSAAGAMAALLDMRAEKNLTDEDLARLGEMIERAREDER